MRIIMTISKIIKILLFTTIFLSGTINSQPFTKKYIMSFHTCGANCTGFADHMVNLAESDDGINWTLVPNFVPYKGSVPDVIIRGSKLYIYTPGNVKRYDKNTNTWDANTEMVGILDSNNMLVNFVDPSVIVDKNGKLVMFFLNSTGLTGDPAGCSTYPCTKYFNSAIEEEGSDGAHFILLDGNRAEIELTNSPQGASDPDIFYDGNNYILYISRGGSTTVLKSENLNDSYSSYSTLINDVLTDQGGVPCGIFNNLENEYWTFIHANVNGEILIKRATHKNFDSKISNFTTVIDGSIVGDNAVTTESPGICLNTFITTDVAKQSKVTLSKYLLSQNYPNPFNPTTTIKYSLPEQSKVKIEVFNLLGERVAVLVDSEKPTGTFKSSWKANNLPSGIYFISINAIGIDSQENFSQINKAILLK
jgi:hypothetical protein